MAYHPTHELSMSGEEIAYDATVPYAVSGTDLGCAATSVFASTSPGTLSSYARATKCPNAIFGIDIVYGATCLRACYAMSGTDLAHDASRPRAICYLLQYRIGG
eukprot:1795533-Rhodomonas_salina.8